MTVHVLHVLPHEGGGGEHYVDVLEGLTGFEHRRFYLSSGRTPASALRSTPARWPRLAAHARRADLIHVHGDAASMIALPLLRTRPALMTTHGLNLLRRIEGPQRRLTLALMRRVTSFCRLVICTSETERGDLVAALSLTDTDSVIVIHNGVELPAVSDAGDRLSVRAQLGAGPDTVLGLFAGRIEPNKEPMMAARAANRVRAGGADFVLALAGDGPQLEQLRAQAGDGIRILGHRSDMNRLLAASDVFIQTSQREGLSFALLESMAHGLAVIAADSPGQPEALGDTGRLFAAGDEDALVAELTDLTADPELRASLGEKARRRSELMFSVERFLSETEAAYRQALAPGGRTRR